ncbi:hypothetical protein SXCC_03518 [Gluconacetobacter sp. SXCC-1]|nr:hypothetical protein SXCC_03518 [Gluconacetobacter sp. SXCC-1]
MRARGQLAGAGQAMPAPGRGADGRPSKNVLTSHYSVCKWKTAQVS